MSNMSILGDPPFSRHADGKLKSRIATIFPESNTLVTLPGIHATQRQAYLDHLNQQRSAQGQGPLGKEEEELHWQSAVDLIVEDNALLIRPDPENMPLAFQADELLQDLVPEHRIKFLGVLNAAVREAIKKRGEWWRIAPLPKSVAEMKHLIGLARVGLQAGEIYYYCQTTGTRYLTCQQFAALEDLDEAPLRRQLLEIQQYSGRINVHGFREVMFFAAADSFTAAAFAAHDFCALDAQCLRAAFRKLSDDFRRAVDAELQQDDVENVAWRNRMLAALLGQDETTVSEESLPGLSPEFFMQIEWLPGGYIEDDELVLTSALDEPADADDPELKTFRDDKPQKFIVNFIREYGDLEYVNIGRVIGSLSRRSTFSGRRGVYIAVLRLRGGDSEIVKIIRMQKYGVREYLSAGRPLLDAILQSEEYTEYILDRRLGCRQLGMNLPVRTVAQRLHEVYAFPGGGTRIIYSPYFERDYIQGIATDKVPLVRFGEEGFALRFARLLGRVAAPNIIVGRSDSDGKAFFDDGDEVLIEDAAGLPLDIIVADHTGTFNDYLGPLERFAAEYARPVTRRWQHLSNPGRFVDAYLEAFVDRFLHVQQEYRRHRRAFERLFKYRPRDEAGSLAFRWEMILKRLNGTDPCALAGQIRRHAVAPS